MTKSNCIESIALEAGELIRNTHFRHERDRAVADIIKENDFALTGKASGPYNLKMSIVQNRVVIKVKDAETCEHEVTFSLMPLRSLIKDYSIVCDSYFEAVKLAEPRKVEAIDMGRRGLHNEGAELLQELLEKEVVMDMETARRMFTLVYVLQLK